MVEVTSDPEEQTGTGESRSASPPSEDHEAERDHPLRPDEPEETRGEINRSGSGGSGGPLEGDPSEEGSGSRSLDDMLGGGR